MTAEEKDTRRSRRARRREQGEAEPGAPGSEERAEAGAADDEPEPAEDSADEAAAEPAASAPDRQKKKKKKKRAADADLDPDNIRDRNRRIRARAAERRREKREGATPALGLDASEMVDDALARSTQAVGDWLKNNFNIVQWVIIGGLVAVVAWKIYDYRTGKQLEKASDDLTHAVEDEQGRIAGEPLAPGVEKLDPRKSFADDAARLAAAAKSYRAAESVRPGSGTSILARLGLAGVLYDQGKYDEAKKEYEAVKDSSLGQHDDDVRGRAIEGIGMSLEAKGQSDAAEKTYRELENSKGKGFSSLGLYHQARIELAKGNKDKAKELLKKVQDQLKESGTPYPATGYLHEMTSRLLRQIDPTAVATDVEELMRQLKHIPGVAPVTTGPTPPGPTP